MAKSQRVATGVFQVESRVPVRTLPRLQHQNYIDLVIEVTIVRPSPIQGGMVHQNLRPRQSLEKVTYASATVETVLKRTLGVRIVQEQMMRWRWSLPGLRTVRRINCDALWPHGNVAVDWGI